MFKAVLARTAAVAIAASAVAGTYACGTPTKVTSEWKTPAHAARPMKRVAVFSVEVKPEMRHTIEDRFTAELTKQGVDAVPSHAIFGETLPQKDIVRATLASGGYDGALVLTLKQVERKQRTEPNEFYGTPYGTPWGTEFYEPSHTVTDETAVFESTLWDLRDGQQIWAARTKTENPKSGKDFAKSFSKKLVPEVTEEGFIVASGD